MTDDLNTLQLKQLKQEAQICAEHAKACQEHGNKLQSAADNSLQLAAVLQLRAKRATERIEALNNQRTA
jgi:hypothetical protein